MMRPLCARAIAALGVVVQGACGSSPIVDANQPVSDAAIPDAIPWQCSVRPAPLPPSSSGAVTVAFDDRLVLPKSGGEGTTLVFADGRLAAFTPYSVHFHDLTGAELVNHVYSSSPVVRLLNVAAGMDDFGTVVEIVRTSVERAFCVLDRDGQFAEQRCTGLAAATGGARATFDGSNYRVYDVRNGAMVRSTFDDTGALLQEDTLWSGAPDTDLIRVHAAGDVETIITTGTRTVGTCGMIYEVRGSSGSYSRRELLPADTAAHGIVGTFEADGRGSMLIGTACRKTDTATCALWEEQRATLFVRYEEGKAISEPFPVGLASSAWPPPIAVFFDDASTVVMFSDLHDMWLSRLAPDGTLELSALRVPLAYETAGNELGVVAAGISVAPNDYVIVYGVGGPEGPNRIARFSVP